jgi:hypothetical protein
LHVLSLRQRERLGWNPRTPSFSHATRWARFCLPVPRRRTDHLDLDRAVQGQAGYADGGAGIILPRSPCQLRRLTGRRYGHPEDESRPWQQIDVFVRSTVVVLRRLDAPSPSMALIVHRGIALLLPFGRCFGPRLAHDSV